MMMLGHTASAAYGGDEEPVAAETARLARLVYAHTPHDGSFRQCIPGLHVCRFSQANVDYLKTFDLPTLLVVAQGAKAVTVGQEIYPFGHSQILMLPVALPIAMRATHASPTEPFLSVKLDLDPQRLAELALKVYPHGLPAVTKWSPGYIMNADLGLIKAVTRLVECLASPGDAQLLAPLALDEILIRVLRSPIGVRVAEIGFADSGVHRVAKAIAWLQDNFAHQMKVADLADLVHMSESAFRVHFKSITSMSPLQYQKALRLHEARRLMASGSQDATSASQLVGYVSISQFSREYSHFFGSPPKRDMARLRQQAQTEEG